MSATPVGSGAKSQPPTILVHFEDIETLMMTSKMCIVLSTTKPNYVYIFCVTKKLMHLFGAPTAGALRHMPLPTPLQVATASIKSYWWS